jgi:hypothetical protein
MMACTSPGAIESESLEDILALHPGVQVIDLQHCSELHAAVALCTALINGLSANRPFEADLEQLSGLDGKLHRQLRNTSLQKPFTIMRPAASASSPRC